MKFKTNIKCGGCIAAVTPVMDAMVGPGNWSVDVADPQRVMTIDGPVASVHSMQEQLSALGYQAEELSEA